jgi:hypothetical protein
MEDGNILCSEEFINSIGYQLISMIHKDYKQVTKKLVDIIISSKIENLYIMALNAAALIGDIDIVKKLLETTKYQSSALAYAVKSESVEIIDFLLDFAQNIGRNEIIFAASSGNISILNRLVSKANLIGSSIPTDFLNAAILSSVRIGSVDMTERLLDLGANNYIESMSDAQYYNKLQIINVILNYVIDNSIDIDIDKKIWRIATQKMLDVDMPENDDLDWEKIYLTLRDFGFYGILFSLDSKIAGLAIYLNNRYEHEELSYFASNLLTAFENAVDNSNEIVVKMFLKYENIRAKVLVTNVSLKIACVNGDIKMVDILLGCSEMRPSDDDNKILLFILRNGNKKILDRLLEDSRVDPGKKANSLAESAIMHNNLYGLKKLLRDPRFISTLNINILKEALKHIN